MPSTSSPAADRDARRARIARLDRLADTLDARFRVFGFPVGWDSILGLIPGVGDVVTAGPGAVMLWEGYRMGARKRSLARIAANTGVDMVLGGIPLIGDAFDVVFKSHRRNIDILKRELARIEAGEDAAPAAVDERTAARADRITREEGDPRWQTDTDRKTERATATGSSETMVPLNRREGLAVHSSATSPRKTSGNARPNDPRARRA